MDWNKLLEILLNNLLGIILSICFLVIVSKGTDKVFPKFKKAKVTTPAGSAEIERDCGDGEQKDRRECQMGRRKTDVCATHCDMAEALAKNTAALEELKKQEKILVEHEEELWINSLKRQFYSKELPISERMYAGLRYVWWGENGDVRTDVKEFVKQYPEIYKAVIAGRSELRLGNYAEGREPKNI